MNLLKLEGDFIRFALSLDSHGRQGLCVSSLNPLIALGLLLAGISQAEELVIESKPFELVHQLEATVMPAEALPLIRIDAKAWNSFPITALAAHGSQVAKGDTLITIDARDIDREIEAIQRQLRGHELAIADAGDHLAKLEETAESRLEAVQRQAHESAERLDYFTKTGRKTEEEEALHTIERNEQWLANEKEELRQLKQMYEADDLTEDTEEIILTRQQNAVERAELMLRHSKLSQTRVLEIMLPRKAKELSDAAAAAAVALKYAQRKIPREIEQAKASLKALEVTAAADRVRLTDLQHDRRFFEIKAEVAGTFYHGAIENGSWTTGELLRGLRVGGSAPRQLAFASLVPADAKLELVAHTDATKARQLTDRISGIATLAGSETFGETSGAMAVRVSGRSLVPDPKGRYQVSFSLNWPPASSAVVGNPASLQLLVYQKPEAIVVPSKALKYGARGWSVELKLADGKTERRSVTRGPQAGDQVEILSGLEVGQVILAP